MLDCRTCGELKKEEEFSKKSGTRRGYSYKCKNCHNEYVRTVWYKKNSDVQKKSSREWRQRNPVKVKAKIYGIEEHILQGLVDIGKCQACGDPYDCVDHCHKSGEFRGLLCSPCNKALGFARDDPERLENLKKYLQSVAG